jgi:hypothetical protein
MLINLSELIQHISNSTRVENPHDSEHSIAKTRIRETDKIIQAIGMFVEDIRPEKQLLIHLIFCQATKASWPDETRIVPNLVDVSGRH